MKQFAAFESHFPTKKNIFSTIYICHCDKIGCYKMCKNSEKIRIVKKSKNTAFEIGGEELGQL